MLWLKKIRIQSSLKRCWGNTNHNKQQLMKTNHFNPYRLNMEIKTIRGEQYVKCYWPNSIRFEDIDGDNEKAYWCIYINGERVDTAPLAATQEEARIRLLDLCYENWVEEEQRIWKPLNDLNNKEKWKATNTKDSLKKSKLEE